MFESKHIIIIVLLLRFMKMLMGGIIFWKINKCIFIFPSQIRNLPSTAQFPWFHGFNYFRSFHFLVISKYLFRQYILYNEYNRYNMLIQLIIIPTNMHTIQYYSTYTLSLLIYYIEFLTWSDFKIMQFNLQVYCIGV